MTVLAHEEPKGNYYQSRGLGHLNTTRHTPTNEKCFYHCQPLRTTENQIKLEGIKSSQSGFLTTTFRNRWYKYYYCHFTEEETKVQRFITSHD